MKELFLDLLKSGSGVSMVRFMALLSLIFAFVLALMGRDTTIIGIFVTAAFAGKVGQKALEKPAA